jgi:hypothetical protein
MDDNHLLYLTTAEWLKGYASGLDEHLHPALIYRLKCAADLLTAVWTLQPVAWTTDLEFDSDTEVIPAKHKGKLGTRTTDIALYTAPPKRPWVGLTDEQINQYDYQYRDLLYDAEKMLREKNSAA